MIDNFSNRVNALADVTFESQFFDLDSLLNNLTSRIETVTTNLFESTIAREDPLLQEPDLPGMLPQSGSPISSNIAQYVYYPADESIIITFSNMKDYQYWEVTQAEFYKIINGEATAVTKGQNQFGAWYIGKSPSVGAAVYRYLVQANKPWKRLL